MILSSEWIDEVGKVDDGFVSYVFMFLIALFKDLPLLLGISDRSYCLDRDITDTINGNMVMIEWSRPKIVI